MIPHPIPELNWDGDWPGLAAALPLRGVAQQLALQSELVRCGQDGAAAQFLLRVPVETLCSAGNVDKLAAALSQHFGKPVRVQTEIGAVSHTANARTLADQAARQREAEQAVHSDPFVQTLMREFGATIVPGSIKPI
jgi:DNA polymerase-3 subunit gamma/tau